MEIRKFEEKDIKETYDLLNELYSNGIEYNIFVEKYKECLKNEKFYGIVAKENSKIVGVLTSRIINRLVKSKDILFIDDLIVDKDHRNKGIGKLLLKTAIDYAQKMNCQTVELTSYIDNINAHRFYENNGLIKKHYKFKKNF